MVALFVVLEGRWAIRMCVAVPALFDDRALTGYRVSSIYFKPGARSSGSGNAEARRWRALSRPSLCTERPRWRYLYLSPVVCLVEASVRAVGERNGAVRQLLPLQACPHGGYATHFNYASGANTR